jgi:hypothetical protein
MIMKKITAIIFLVVFFVMTLVACSATNNICPAYSSCNTTQTDQNNG